jgi:hypothetical protein
VLYKKLGEMIDAPTDSIDDRWVLLRCRNCGTNTSLPEQVDADIALSITRCGDCFKSDFEAIGWSNSPWAELEG